MPELKLLIIILILNSLEIFGFHAACHFEYKDENHPELGVIEDSKMILWRFGKWSTETFGKFWSKPIYACPTCQSSLHSIPFFLIFLSLTSFSYWWIYPAYILVLAGLNDLITSFKDN